MFDIEAVFCPQCGTMLDDIAARLAEAEQTVIGLSSELAKKVGQNKRMQGQRANGHPPEYDDAMEVAEYWREMLAPRTKELQGPRLEKTIERLQGGYGKDDLKQAVYGYWCKPNVMDGKRVRRGGKRHADLELIMRDAGRVDRGIEMAEAERHFSSEHLNEGGSATAARLCDCGHPRIDHGLFHMQGHEGCYAEACACKGFDDLYRQMDEFHEREGTRDWAQLPPEPAQGRLL